MFCRVRFVKSGGGMAAQALMGYTAGKNHYEFWGHLRAIGYMMANSIARPKIVNMNYATK